MEVGYSVSFYLYRGVVLMGFNC